MKKAILHHLEQQHGPITRACLLSHIRGGEGMHIVSDRQMRAVIEEMIVEDGFLIQSSEKGYQLITTQDQLDSAMEYLDKKAAAVAIRKNSLLRNWRQKQLEPTDLFNQ